MCTIGSVFTRDRDGNPVAFALKTADYMWKGVWHARITGSTGHDILGFNLVERPGVNSGMNDAGLAVMRSFLDYRGPFGDEEPEDCPEADFPVDADNRSAIGAYVLEKFDRTGDVVDYAMTVLPKFTGKGSGQRGGNFMIADAHGRIAVIEHCEDRISVKDYPEGHTARGNNGFLILHTEQETLPEHVRQDRSIRCARMAEAMKAVHDSVPQGMTKPEVLDLLKQTLAWRGPNEDGGIGSCCCLGVNAPGSRTNSTAPCWTITAVIFDLIDRRMHFTRGTPHANPWHTLDCNGS
jgi:hypothetical protein